MSALGFDAQMNAVVETFTHDILASSEIEGVILDSDQVRSSVARRMGVHITGDVEPSHYIEGVVEMMLDVKNWAKKAAVSGDTASRDIKSLVDKGILVPQPGRVRDVSYGISISGDRVIVPGPKDE